MTRVSPYECNTHQEDKISNPSNINTMKEVNQPLNPNKHKQPRTCCTGILPLNLFIVIIISTMILIGCLSVWLSSYLVTEKAINDLSTKLINESGKKIITYLDGVMTPIAKLTKTMAREYTTGVVTIPMFRKYLFPKFVEFGTTGCGFFYSVPLPSRYTYTISGTTSNPFPVFAYQPFGYPGSIRDTVNITTGEVVKVNSTVDLTPYVPAKQDFFIYTLKNFNEKGLEGVYGEPYKVLGSTVAIYYSQLMFDPEIYQLNKTKSLVGLAKVNLSLETIVNFLSKITLLGNGYVLVAQNNGVVIGGSINTITGDGLTSSTIFDVSSRNAGSLLKQFYELNNRTFNTLPTTMKIVGREDGVSYIITPYKYDLENLEWNIFFVLYESEVTEALILTTSISIGVTVAIIILGIVGSVITGFTVSKPMKFLEKQFERIKVLDLESVSSNSSMFREVNSIFSNLKNTVEWLAEIKTFIPQSVFEQIQQEKLAAEQESGGKEFENGEAIRNSLSSSAISKSHHSSSKSSMRKGTNASHLFKMGLSKKGCAVLHVKIDGLSSKLPDIISDIFADIANLLGPIVKLSQGNLNVYSCDEFQLSLTSNSADVRLQEKAFDAALKIVKAVDSLQQDIIARVGVSIGDGHVGNIGTSTSRFFSLVGSVSEQSKTFAQLAIKFNVKIVTDDISIPSSQKLICRPLDRLLKSKTNINTKTTGGGGDHHPVSSEEGQECNQIFTLFEVIGQKNQENDEWLYELQNSKQNNKFQEYSKVFDLFSCEYWKTVEQQNKNISLSDIVGQVSHALQILTQFSEQEFNNQDVSCERMIACLKTIMDEYQVMNLKTSKSVIEYLTRYSNSTSFELTINK